MGLASYPGVLSLIFLATLEPWSVSHDTVHCMLMALVALYLLDVKVMAPADKNVNDEHSVTSLLVDMMSLPMHSVAMTSW